MNQAYQLYFTDRPYNQALIFRHQLSAVLLLC